MLDLSSVKGYEVLVWYVKQLPRAVVDTQRAPQGHTVTPPEPKAVGTPAISTLLLLAELPFSTLIAINVPEPLALGLIDCLIEKVNILACQ